MAVRREGMPSTDYMATLASEFAPNMHLAIFTSQSRQGTQWFLREAIYLPVIAQAYEYTEPRLGMTRWPTIGEGSDSLLFNITEGSGENQVSTVPATVDLLAAVDSARAVRQAVIVERMDDGQWRVAGYGESQQETLAALNLQVTTSGTLYAVGLDDYGIRFVPSLAVAAGQRIRPNRFAGWLYEITEPGVLPATEPQWWPIEGDNPSRQLGTARAIAVRYYRPLALGPITAEML
ncbi:hypothetical protein SAMN05216198_1629 [Halopseudomonas litoralis]|uniref:Uncharacterized protein n=1 Tax=Halopseudomonas litoralis TaxID=797277 RepID=A0A1H1R0S9_9GAMM|nr:hypothetical protein SAMN05216198_1629 [Halopseudomonas litoralis]